MKKEERTCDLCGYPAEEYVVYSVPLASPPQSRVICLQCADEVHDLVLEEEKKDIEAQARRAAEWVQSPAGIEATQKSLAEAKKLADQFRKATIWWQS
jgi:hypothetical protein